MKCAVCRNTVESPRLSPYSTSAGRQGSSQHCTKLSTRGNDENKLNDWVFALVLGTATSIHAVADDSYTEHVRWMRVFPKSSLEGWPRCYCIKAPRRRWSLPVTVRILNNLPFRSQATACVSKTREFSSVDNVFALIHSAKTERIHEQRDWNRANERVQR